jgi:hypothetical protein
VSDDRQPRVPRNDVIAYLRTLSDNPQPLPKAAEAPAKSKSSEQLGASREVVRVQFLWSA